MSINRILADLGKAVDSSSTGNFLNKEASGAEFNPVQWSDINSAPTILDSALASAIIDSAYVQARQTGVGSGGIDSATTIAIIDSDYVGARASTGGSGFTKYQYTATASQTTFQDSDANGNVLSYDADYILVHYNGVLLPSADYTATDGSSVVLGTGADSGSIIGIAKWGAAAGSSSGGSGLAWGGDRALFVPNASGSFNTEYVSIPTPSNASSFGGWGTQLYSISQGFSDATYVLYAGGNDVNAINTNAIRYYTSSTLSNVSSFGNLSAARTMVGTLSDGTYGVMGGGYEASGAVTTIEYVTIATPSNTTDFGDLAGWWRSAAGLSDGTYGLYGGGYNYNGDNTNDICYITVASPANASDFGDLTQGRKDAGACGDGTYGVFIAGGFNNNTIDYVTVATQSNATDFGDTSITTSYSSACSNSTHAVYDLNNNTNIEYITIATPSNGTDFGDLINSGMKHLGSGAAS